MLIPTWVPGPKGKLKNVLARGGVLMGSSAGAEIQSSTLTRGSPGIGSHFIVVSLDPKYNVGFGLVPNTVYDAHIGSRERWTHLYEPLSLDTNLIGIGATESTAFVIRKSVMEVVGAGKVAVSTWENVKSCSAADSCYLTFEQGDFYDICARQVSPDGKPVRIAMSRLLENPVETFIYPGSLKAELILKHDFRGKDAELTIYNLRGNKLFQKKFTDQSEISFEHGILQSGLVVMSLSVGGNTYRQKILLR